MKSIAFMNLKKIGGGSSANHKNLVEDIEENKESIIKEIEIIKPDLVIGCGIYNYWDLFYKDINFEKSVYDNSIATYNKMMIIDYLLFFFLITDKSIYSL